MTPLAVSIAIVSQLFLVAGQVFLKHAMNPERGPFTARTAVRLLPGIACLTVWFFLWLGLLQRWELSRLFPVEGLDPVLVVLAAWLVLHERVPPRAWGGIALISVGVYLVSSS